jgi:hypothetical protein
MSALTAMVQVERGHLFVFRLSLSDQPVLIEYSALLGGTVVSLVFLDVSKELIAFNFDG